MSRTLVSCSAAKLGLEGAIFKWVSFIEMGCNVYTFVLDVIGSIGLMHTPL